MTDTKIPVKEFLHILNFQIASRKRDQLLSSEICYLCHRFNSLRRLGGDKGRPQKCPHVPPVPQNSYLGFEDGVNQGQGLFDTSIFQECTDPLGFKLPPVFSRNVVDGETEEEHRDAKKSRRRKKKKTPHSRIIPTVSENTFVTSNLKDDEIGEVVGYLDNDNYDDDIFYEDDEEDDEEGNVIPSTTRSTSQIQLPRINSGQNNLVSSWHSADDDGSEAYTDDVSMTSRSEPIFDRTETVDREKTGASLRIDEDFVPMSVFIKQVAEREHSGGLAQHRYDDDLSSSISGSLGVSRETSLGESDYSSGKFGDWCKCLDPSTEDLPCLECLHPHTHERWCTRNDEAGRNGERQRTCLLCGKLIRPLKSKKRERPQRRKNGRSVDRKDSRYRQTPDTAVSKSMEEVHDRSTCSGKNRSGRLRGSRASMEPDGSDQHVRFDDHVQTVSPDNGKVLPRTALDYEKVLNYDHVPGIPDLAEKPTPLFKARHPVSKPDMRIHNLGVSVHKMAYDMALTDARATGAYKKKGGKKKRIGSEKPTGTIFSYFPLLKEKRPLSEGERPVLDLGVKQDEGRKVAPKNYMKHIFGNIKMADYYPGGKKWR